MSSLLALKQSKRKADNHMYYGKVEICGVNTNELKVLTDDEKATLLKKTKQGDESAREELIYGNLRLVLSVIQRFAGKKDNIDDIFQVGCIGLIKAIDNFNIDLDVKFSTYAVPMKCSLGKKKGDTSPKWLKIKQQQGFQTSLSRKRKMVYTSAKEIKRTKISKSKLEIQNGLIRQSESPLIILSMKMADRRE